MSADQSVEVFEIEWTEHERNWGQRPDGFTYHSSLDIANRYVKDYWDGMPDEAPDEYSSPSAVRAVMVNPVFAMLVAGKGTVYSDKKVS